MTLIEVVFYDFFPFIFAIFKLFHIFSATVTSSFLKLSEKNLSYVQFKIFWNQILKISIIESFAAIYIFNAHGKIFCPGP